MKVERAAQIVDHIGSEHAQDPTAGEAHGSQALARHIGVDFHELRQHAQLQATRLSRAVENGAVLSSVIRLAYLAGFFGGAIWARATDTERAVKGDRADG